MSQSTTLALRHLLVVTIIISAFIPEISHANILDNFGNAILGILNNTFLRALSIAAIIAAGLMALSGRVQWLTFITIMLAVVIIFGAAGIVDYIRSAATTASLGFIPVG